MKKKLFVLFFVSMFFMVGTSPSNGQNIVVMFVQNGEANNRNNNNRRGAAPNFLFAVGVSVVAGIVKDVVNYVMKYVMEDVKRYLQNPQKTKNERRVQHPEIEDPETENEKYVNTFIFNYCLALHLSAYHTFS